MMDFLEVLAQEISHRRDRGVSVPGEAVSESGA
jgi:hypothetical protein